MGNEVTVAGDNVPALVAEMAEEAAGYAEAAKAPNTRRAYRSDWGGVRRMVRGPRARGHAGVRGHGLGVPDRPRRPA
jgi:hypothetical protein